MSGGWQLQSWARWTAEGAVTKSDEIWGRIHQRRAELADQLETLTPEDAKTIRLDGSEAGHQVVLGYAGALAGTDRPFDAEHVGEGFFRHRQEIRLVADL